MNDNRNRVKRVVIIPEKEEKIVFPRFAAIHSDTKDMILQSAKNLFPVAPKEKTDRVKLVILREIFRSVGLSTKAKYMTDLGCYLFGITPEENKLATCVLISNYIMGWKRPPTSSIQRGIGIEYRKEIKALKRAHGKEFDFYQTWAWKSVRYQALKKYGAKCMLCGATPADGAKICVDHIKPRSQYPELALDINNLQILCDECNVGKGAWDKTDWR